MQQQQQPAGKVEEAAAELVTYRLVGNVALLSLNRPHRRNALTSGLLAAIVSALQRAERDPQVRAVVLTGTGQGFCAGADLKDSSNRASAEEKAGTAREVVSMYDMLLDQFKPAVLALCNIPKPVIAAVNGAAAGAGASLALACDFRVMADDAYLLQAFINIGLAPDAGGAYFLVRQVGYSKALELSIEGKPIKAETCLQLGLANKVVPAADLLRVSLEWAERLAQRATFAVGLTKSALHYAATHNLAETIEYESRLQQFLIQSDDSREGVGAFLQKRRPRFSGARVAMPGGIIAKI